MSKKNSVYQCNFNKYDNQDSIYERNNNEFNSTYSFDDYDFCTTEYGNNGKPTKTFSCGDSPNTSICLILQRVWVQPFMGNSNTTNSFRTIPLNWTILLNKCKFHKGKLDISIIFSEGVGLYFPNCTNFSSNDIIMK